MKIISIETMRNLERRAIDSGVSGYTLMRRAGEGAAEEIRRFAQGKAFRRAVILAGRGNNGGDALVAAPLLGIPAVIYATGPLEMLRGEAADYFGETVLSDELNGLAVFSAAMAGGIGAFLWFNGNPATVMMGDTGSLAMGGAAAAVAVFSRTPLLILVLGVTYIASCVSVIAQVISFKLTGKRVLLMAPLHHHFEKKGLPEQKIVLRYALVTVAAGLIALAA